MATVLETPIAAPLDADDAGDFMLSDGGSAVLHGISWKMYRRLRKMPENYNIRMTYEEGELEIMSPSHYHEKIATLLGDLINVWRVEHRVPVSSCRSMTIRRSILQRGFEPDNCYYVQHEPQMWDKRKIDFKVNPPPDLAIEVEVTRKLADKMAIYAAFRVPELWCWRDGGLSVHELTQEGSYAPRETSICFPAFPIAKAQEIVRRLGAEHETELVCAFRDWVRANAQPGS